VTVLCRTVYCGQSNAHRWIPQIIWSTTFWIRQWYTYNIIDGSDILLIGSFFESSPVYMITQGYSRYIVPGWDFLQWFHYQYINGHFVIHMLSVLITKQFLGRCALQWQLNDSLLQRLRSIYQEFSKFIRWVHVLFILFLSWSCCFEMKCEIRWFLLCVLIGPVYSRHETFLDFSGIPDFRSLIF